MAKIPSHRFSSMHDLVDALEPLVSPPRLDKASLRPAAPTLGTPEAMRATQVSTKSGLAQQPLPSTPPLAVVPPAPSRRRARAVAAIAGLLVAALAIGAALRARSRAPAVAEAADARPAIVGTSLRDEPLPRSNVPEALAAYHDGMVAMEEGNEEPAVAGFERAFALDPHLDAARVRLGLILFWTSATVRGREVLHQASLERGELDERDRVLLEMHEPLVVAEKADSREAARRMADAVRRFPDDVEMRTHYGSLLLEMGELPDAIVQLERASELDPRRAVPWLVLGQAHALRGEAALALAAWETCASRASSGVRCRRSRASTLAQEGRCVEMEGEARAMKAADPAASLGYRELARALASLGHPPDAVLDELGRAWSRGMPSRRQVTELSDRVNVDTLRGHLGDAEQEARELEGAVADDPGSGSHAHVAYVLALLELEMGRTADAAATAQTYLDRVPTWIPDPSGNDETILVDPTPLMAAIVRRAGRDDAAGERRRRDAWIAETRARTAPFFQRAMWFPAYALPAETSADADEALAALPNYEPLPARRIFSLPDALLGKVYLLAGRPADALPHLERGAAACRALDEPILHVRAHYDLGRAREATGDKAGACSAYAAVLARWGDAKPRSVTADAARARVKALACPPPGATGPGR
jgi:serine/threonine-protein kinase